MLYHDHRDRDMTKPAGKAPTEPLVLIRARTFNDLHDRLPDLNVDVPPRPAERGDTPEIYSIIRLLGSIPFSPRDFPLQLAKTERPDFALDLAGWTIGIEHTEAVPRNASSSNWAESRVVICAPSRAIFSNGFWWIWRPSPSGKASDWNTSRV